MTTQNRTTELHAFLRLCPGRTLAWIADPLGSNSDKLVAATNAAARSLIALDVAVDDVLAALPAPLPVAKLAEAVKVPHTSAQLRHAAAQGALAAARESLAEALDAFNLPDPAKPAEVAEDIELRAWFFALNADARARVLTECADGRHLGVLVAAARFGAPDPAAEQARNVFRSLQERERPAVKAELDRRADVIEWGANVLAHCRAIWDSSASVIGPSPLLDPAALRPAA